MLSADRCRAILFTIGDCLFLIAVGMITTLVMQIVHRLGWNLAPTCIVGMAAAMLVQMLMAVCATPLLGPIESVTPSMVVGMLSPMVVCLMHMVGHETSPTTAIAAGAVFGAIMSGYIVILGIRTRQQLRQAYPVK